MLDGPFSILKGNEPNKMTSLYPMSEIEQMNDFTYKGINNCVYRVGFAASQAAYQESVELLFSTLDSITDTRQKEILARR